MENPFYITTPIYYVNASPHLGHAYTSIVADAANRYHRMRRQNTFFLTGTDEHGDKIEAAADKANMTPRAYADEISAKYKNLWPRLNVCYDRFIRTTDREHIAVVEAILRKIHERGDIYFSEYEGLYCFGCERFFTERELKDGKCPDHGTEPEPIKESNYFFRMSRYQQWLIDHIHQHPDMIRPERYRNEVLSFLKEPLEDLCISRPKTRLRWGITLPFDPEYVTYVWFDALINYISALGYPDGETFKTFWPETQHLIAKDILKPHGIYWPIMLKAAGIEIYKHLNVHGFWVVDESKMSKSIGNVVDPLDIAERYGLDAFRYFLLRDMAFGLDSNFSEQALIQRINADLANDLGNLFSRVLAMVHKYLKGVVPEIDSASGLNISMGLDAQAADAIAAYEEAMNEMAFHKALMAVWEFIGHMNKYIDMTNPWTLAKSRDTEKELCSVLYNLLEGLRVISGLIYPVMPDTARNMQKHLGQNPDDEFYTIDRLIRWNSLKPGTPLPKTTTLFPRIDSEKMKTVDADPAADAALPPDIKPPISIEDFQRVDLRIGTILSAEEVPKSSKLLRLQVDLGKQRTIVAGISTIYRPEELIGKQVVVVANLKPAKLMGILSEGMLLAAVEGPSATIAVADRKVLPGTPLR